MMQGARTAQRAHAAHWGQAANALMPMNLVFDDAGTIVHVGPTLQKLRPHIDMVGTHIHDLFAIRDNGRGDEGSVFPLDTKLYLTLKSSPATVLKGIAIKIPGADVYLLNLSFGMSIVEAVRTHGLSDADFAHTDMVIEMLYLVEAKSAVLEEIKQLNARLQGAKSHAEEQAQTDALTGLKNRRAMDHVVARLLGGRVPFSLMHLDLDYFKRVNDTHGHAAGDAVLERVADILREETRDDDMVARVGGDEFVLVFSRMVDSARLLRTAHRIIARLEEPIDHNGLRCAISGSIGITTSALSQCGTPQAMIHDADLALYAAKHAGRATAIVFDPARHAHNAPSVRTDEA
ncbi:GGDEF domain-containing protein [Celeribacter marinus]|uniref:Sensory box/GGDEF family protein n=1 Tax=Celeribacter marinus TaxID=1397108 RepID=A0A0N9ZGF7_9RHOB|nr:sensory box/GGDEF family protein [Celeribacter marinus]SFK00283.1 diguanylate cyclase (GGDEF) domain-containing protein [Celeribacter marinus]